MNEEIAANAVLRGQQVEGLQKSEKGQRIRPQRSDRD